jgi:uncharacterized phage protein gp47/JayE
MTIVDGTFEPTPKETILQELIASAEEAFDREFNADEVSVLRSFYDPVAEVMAEQQVDIGGVLSASQIDNAEGASLSLLGALIGVQRQRAQPAETRLRFSRDGPTPRSYSIPEGTEAQTDSTDAVVFATDEPGTLAFIDGFEENSLSNYGGDTGSFTRSTTQAYEGSYSLEGTATGSIFNLISDYGYNTTFSARHYLTAGADQGVIFGAQDENSYYRATVDESAGSVLVEVIDNSSVIDSSSTSVTVPTGEWLRSQVNWREDGEIEHVLYDSSGSELARTTLVEAEPTYVDGGVGFYSGGSNEKYIDNYTMEAVGIPATATEAGLQTNVNPDSAIVLPQPPTGIQSVTNPVPAEGGVDEEDDEPYRERAKRELSEGARATQPALITQINRVNATKSVSVIVNDTDSTDAAGRPAHSFEPVVDVESEFYEDVAEAIIDTKAAGDASVGGYAGSAVSRTIELVNGQEKEIEFSIPTQVQIYVDCDIVKTDTYGGNEAVQDSIVQYVGGTLSTSEDIDGELEVGDDVIYNQVLEAVMNVPGVHDVTNLELGTSSSPTGMSNVTIADAEAAFATAEDASLDISASDL